MEKDIKIFNENGLKVKDLLELLKNCPPEATVLLNHKSKIVWQNENDTTEWESGWVFDEIVEARCEEIVDDERYPEWKKDNMLVWLTHNFEDGYGEKK